MAEVMDTKSMTRLNNLKPGEGISTADKQFMQVDELITLASIVIEKQNIELGPAAVCYFLTYPNISKKRSAKVTKCNRKLKHFSGFDYIIEFSGELFDMLDTKTKEILMWNQLLHLNPFYKPKSQEWVMKTRKPQVADYYEIADSLGTDWQKTIQATQGSLYDLEPESEGQVSLF